MQRSEEEERGKEIITISMQRGEEEEEGPKGEAAELKQINCREEKYILENKTGGSGRKEEVRLSLHAKVRGRRRGRCSVNTESRREGEY